MKNKLLWGVFILYLFLSGYAISHHELWADEVHSWNIAKGSHNYADMIHNSRYEGHPPAWYTILWSISRFTHNVDYMKTVQWLIAATTVFMILFLSPFPFSTKILIPFGYYFLFEYAVISRNYAIGVLLVCCICYILPRDFKYKTLLYYTLLFCLSNTHLLAAILAGSLHLYFLLWNGEKKRRIGIHIALGILMILPALYFIFPPRDSELNLNFWLSRWTLHQLNALQEIPLRAFLPFPAWWNYHFWNTEFLLESKNKYDLLKFIDPLLSIAILALGTLILKRSSKSLDLFIANVLVSFLVAASAQQLTNARYSGFIFIGFIAAYWLHCKETPVAPSHSRLVDIMLSVQLAAGVFAIVKDIQLPFSNLYRIAELIKEVPPGDKIVTDYWTMNGYVAFLDKPAYCVDTRKEMSFVVWNSDMATLQNDRSRYSGGLNDLFSKQRIHSVYMVSMAPEQQLYSVDPKLPASFHITLIDKREGAIEKGGNLYLYRISSL